MKNKVGRPTKYNSSFIETAREYIDSCGREATELPTIEGLSRIIGVDDETIGLWAKDDKDFSATIKELKNRQKEQLMNDGMYGGKEVNSTMAIFLLKANHNMIETEKKILAGDDEAPIKVDINSALEKIYGDRSSS